MASPNLNSVGVNDAVPVSSNINIRALVNTDNMKWGTGAAGTGVTLTYSFITSSSTFGAGAGNTSYGSDEIGGPEYEPTTATALTTSEKTAVQQALQDWANVANVKFTLVSDNATTVGEIRIGKSAVVGNNDAAGWAYTPWYTNFPAAGDLWLARVGDGFNDDGGAVPKGSYDYSTLLHELGHALGLQHPHSDAIPGETTLPETAETMLLTVMSYQYGVIFEREPSTPMVLDIQAMQYLYGANNTFNSGNNTYTYTQAGQYLLTIWDAGGTDTIVYSSATGGVINLNPGAASQLGDPFAVYDYDSFGYLYDETRTVWIAYGVQIENATGGSGNDQIIGNDWANTLKGYGGDDLLEGGSADDLLLGGVGNDDLGGGTGVDVMFGDDGNDTLRGGAGADDMRGATGNDMLYGGSSADQLKAGAGNDTLDSGAGNDILTSGDGNDRFVFDDALAADNVDTVVDFQVGADTIVLDQGLFTVLGPGSLSAANFAANPGHVPGDNNDFILYDTTTGGLYYDADGSNPGAAAVQFAMLTGAPLISATDLEVVA